MHVDAGIRARGAGARCGGDGASARAGGAQLSEITRGCRCKVCRRGSVGMGAGTRVGVHVVVSQCMAR